MSRSDEGSDACVFCRIAREEIPAEVVLREDEVVAFRDVNPQAPTHILVISTRHVSSVAEMGSGDRDLAGELLLAAARVAREEGLEAEGYRLVVNTGSRGGQTVDHIHVHVLGGRRMTWPPG